MNQDQRVLGYDAREMWMDRGSLWTPERREGYLLRVDVAKPLSTDHVCGLYCVSGGGPVGI